MNIFEKISLISIFSLFSLVSNTFCHNWFYLCRSLKQQLTTSQSTSHIDYFIQSYSIFCSFYT